MGSVVTVLGRLVCVCAVACGVFGVTSPGVARAFSQPEAYFAPAADGYGGGRWFSGSPADGYGCSVCHSKAPGQPTYPLSITGLPIGGYRPEQVSEVRIRWPEFTERLRALRPDPTVELPPDAATPSVGMIAELVSDSGRGSGMVEIGIEPADPREYCEPQEGFDPALGASIYDVRPGDEPRVILPDHNGVLRCYSRQLGQRCIIALLDCGVEQLRVRWTAPEQREGTIWLAAGFVATEALSSTWDDDSVYEALVPILEADSGAEWYEESLANAACAVGRIGGRGGRWSGRWVLLGLCGVALWRRWGRRQGNGCRDGFRR